MSLKTSLCNRIGADYSLDINIQIEKFDKCCSFHFEDRFEYEIFRETFVEEIYDINIPNSPEVIFDVGSNTGLTLLYFNIKYPDAKIFGFEPDPRNFSKLKDIANQKENISVYQIAVSNRVGKQEFYIDEDIWSSSLLERSTRETVEVEVSTIDNLLQRFAIDEIEILKFDIEGAEARLFEGMEDKKKVKSFIGEVHWDLLEDKAYFMDHISAFSKSVKKSSKKRSIIKGTIERRV